jgi:hypothetical protein
MLCVVFATFSLHRELPNMILGDEPLLSQGGSITPFVVLKPPAMEMTPNAICHHVESPPLFSSSASTSTRAKLHPITNFFLQKGEGASRVM